MLATLVGAALLAPSTAAAHDLLPDLGMAQLQDFKIDRSNGRSLLRYTTIVVNIGDGGFQVHGSRGSAAEQEMSVTQRIFDSTGTQRERVTPGRMYFAGDGHSHWHVRDLEDSVLERLDNGVKVGAGAKHGFCFYDNYAFRLGLAGAPGNPFLHDVRHEPVCSDAEHGALHRMG